MSNQGRVDGKVALITGAARGQGRSHAVRLAEEGADIIAVDLCSQLDKVPYPMSVPDDLAETAHLVEQAGRGVLARQVDIRDLAAMREVVADGVATFGTIDVVVANAGIGATGMLADIAEDDFQETIDVNLGGAWKTVKAALPHLIAADRGGSLIFTNSVTGLAGYANLGSYGVSKHALVGLMRSLAVELAPRNIRVNSVHPGSVASPMLLNDWAYEMFSGGRKGATFEDVEQILRSMVALPTVLVDNIDVSHAVVYLASEESRYVTGTTMVIDAGSLMPIKLPKP